MGSPAVGGDDDGIAGLPAVRGHFRGAYFRIAGECAGVEEKEFLDHLAEDDESRTLVFQEQQQLTVRKAPLGRHALGARLVDRGLHGAETA